MLEKYEVCLGLFHGFDWTAWTTGSAPERLALLPGAQEHVLAQENGKDRALRAVSDLSQAFVLSVPHEEALRIRDDVGFFQAVRAQLVKHAPGDQKTDEELDHAIRQIVSKAVVSDEVVDIFAAAGLKKPDISILSDEFLAEVRDIPAQARLPARQAGEGHPDRAGAGRGAERGLGDGVDCTHPAGTCPRSPLWRAPDGCMSRVRLLRR